MYLPDLVGEFANKSGLPAKFGVRRDVTRTGEEFLHLDHPVALARFIAFAKYRAQKVHQVEVYLRGQVANYSGMVPSLFRGDSQERQQRVDAYGAMLAAVQRLFGQGRFRRSNVGALLQHYGLNTPWIDLVDNIYTAVWFATHRYIMLNPREGYYAKSDESHGWLYLIAASPQMYGGTLHSIDLRKHHSSMNVRLHAQHGLSAAAQEDGAEMKEFDYRSSVVARVRIPNNTRFVLTGRLASPSFLFPPIDIDESYRILLDDRLDQALADVETTFNLADRTLGRVVRMRYRARKRNSPDHNVRA
jgi:hypothetical protein